MWTSRSATCPHAHTALRPPPIVAVGFHTKRRGAAKKLKTLKGKAVISINDHPAIRECFKDFEMEALKLDYTVGGGSNRVERGELVIYSWNREAEPAGLF